MIFGSLNTSSVRRGVYVYVYVLRCLCLCVYVYAHEGKVIAIIAKGVPGCFH